ncbi:MAG: BlaI/MecI/CopY family transcriptional regulator [bacterium]|nr:BlaI/MecI/CopY family transcriptional regulator [bacterium]
MTQVDGLSRRERQIMDIIYERSEATVADVRGALPEPPSYSAVRALLRILEEKGHLQHRQDGPRYVYLATVPYRQARESAMRRVLRTFFGGSASRAVAALLDMEADNLSEDELQHLAGLVDEARKKGR